MSLAGCSASASKPSSTVPNPRHIAGGLLGPRSLGGALTSMGLLILFGLDKKFESWVLQFMPEFLVELSGEY
jgi:hypothetical protein